MAMSPTLLRPRRRVAIPLPPPEGSAPSAPTGISLTTAPLVPTAITLTTAPSPPLTPSLATTPDSPTSVTVETGLVAPTNVGLLAAPKNLTATEVFAPDSPTGLDLTAAPASPTDVQLSAVPSEPTSVTVASVPSSPTGLGLLGAPTNVSATESAATDPYFTDVTLLLAMDGPNGSTTFTDDSISSLAFTGFGNAQISTAQSKFGGASGFFDGTGDYITSNTTTSALTFGTGDFTIEFWLYPTSTPAGGVLQQTPTSVPAIYINIDSIFGVRIGRHGTNQLDAASDTLSLNAWTHLAFVRNSGVVKIFFNGVSQTLTSNNGGIGSYDFSATKAIEIGRTADTSLNGYIDDLRITKAARYSENFTPPTSAFPATNGDPDFANVVLLLQDSLTDESPQNQTLLITGDTALDSTNYKVGNSSFAFDGVGDSIEISQGSSDFNFAAGDFTLEAWVRPTSFGTGKVLLDTRVTASDSGLAWMLTSTGVVRLYTSGAALLDSAASIPLNAWSHLAVTRSGGDIKIWIDGSLSSSTPYAAGITSPRTNPVIGLQTFGSAGFLGNLDAIRITLASRYTTNFTPPTSAFPN